VRRREVPVEGGDGVVEPPPWILKLVPGLTRFNGDGQALSRARQDWCRRNGCWRRPRTCEQTSGRSCEVRRAAS
jgi:hypothetical protein